MKRVYIRRDPFNKDTWTTVDTNNICQYLSEEFTVFPENARIYHGSIAQKNDVTPIDERSIRHLQSLEGEFYVVVYPAYGALEIAMFVVWAITAAFSIYTYMTMPKPQTGIEQASSNNELSARVNKMRPNSRIPEIFGMVRAISDLIAPPLRYFKNNVEIEECLMCLGRGYYEISNVRDGTTSIEQIDGISISVYDPNQNLTTASPKYRYGDVLSHEPLTGKQSRSITGQTLLNPSSARVVSSSITFGYPNIVYAVTDAFANGETIMIEGAKFGVADTLLSGTTDVSVDFTLTVATSVDIYNPQNFTKINISSLLITDPVAGPLDLSGIYEINNVVKSGSAGAWVYEITLNSPATINQNILQISEDATSLLSSILEDNIDSMDLDGTYTININDGSKITLSAPDSDNPGWLKLQNWGSTAGNNIGLYGTQDNWLGWYETDTETDQIYANFFAPGGLYHIGTKGYKEVIGVQLVLEYQAINSSGDPVGDIFYQTQALFGNPKSIASAVGLTLTGTLDTASRIRFRVRRTTVHTSQGTVVDEVQARSVYTMSKLDKLSYEDVTIVRSVTVTNDISAGVKDRELNMLATRKLPLNGIGVLTATRSAAQALIYLALDSKNGRRSANEVDVDQIMAEEQKVISYFNNSKAAEFSYTIDDSNLSFEEIAGMVTSSCFCEPIRFGSKLRMKFEQPQSAAMLLFNHRNKVPKSEKRTYSFGVNKDYDGVELEYTNPIDDARETYSIPEDGSARNPLSIKTTGIRTVEQAKTRAWREWNKLIYQRVLCTFDALDESNLLARNDPILVADNVMVNTQDGEVESVNGLTLNLSQSVDIQVGDSIYLQMPDGTVELIGCQPGAESNQVILNRAPLLPLVVDHDRYAKTTYQIVSTVNTEKYMFLLTEMTPQSKMTNSLTCVNYDDRYYEKDHTFF